MSYLVLARKYRPQNFDEVVGQDHVTTTLKNAFTQKRVHHAFLFCGPRGCGKTTTARILAKALNCKNNDQGHPCGECENCDSIVKGTALDYHEMDGASNRGIDAIRELNDATRYQPAIFAKKIYVIDEVHMLTTEAFNALLKTLEEPPPHIAFVLATTEPNKIPNTIMSRCQRYDFKLVPSLRLSSHLEDIFAKENVEMDKGALELIIQESGGSVRDALSIADQMISFAGKNKVEEDLVARLLGVADKALTHKIVKSLLEQEPLVALEAVDSAIARGVDEFQVVRALVRALRELLIVKMSEGKEDVPSHANNEHAELRKLAGPHAQSRIKTMFDRAIRGCDRLGKTEFPRMVLDATLIEISETEKTIPLVHLLERLGELEAKLSSGGLASAGTVGGANAAPSMVQPSSPAKKKASPPPAPVNQAPSEFAAYTNALQLPGQDNERIQSATIPEPPAPVKAESHEDRKPNPVVPEISPTSSQNSTFEGSPLENWDNVMKRLDDAREIGLMTVYQSAKILEWSTDQVVVGFAADGLTAELASSREKLEAMKAFLDLNVKKGFGITVRLLNKEQEANAQSLMEKEQETLEKDKILRLQEAKEHPMTKSLLETFNAEIKEIKVDV